MIWVNGRPAEYLSTPRGLQMFSEYAYGSRHAGTVSNSTPPIPSWDLHGDTAANTIRLGEVSDVGFRPFPRNYSADMTLDEFHLWKVKQPFALLDGGVDLGNAGQIQEEVIQLRRAAVRQWAVGRYYRPRGDAVFTSAPILMGLEDRRLPPPVKGISPAPPRTDVITGVSDPAPPPRGPSETATSAGQDITVTAPRRRTRLLGFSWTWIPEETSRKDGKPIALDYRPFHPGDYGANEEFKSAADDDVSGDSGSAGDSDVGFKGAGSLDLAPSKSSFRWNTDLEKLTPFSLKQEQPHCTVVLRVVSPDGALRRKIEGGADQGFGDAGFSVPADPANGRHYELTGDDALQYDVRFQIDGLRSDSILLGTPFFDDITFYLAREEIEFLALSGADSRR